MTLREIILSASSVSSDVMIYAETKRDLWEPNTLCRPIEEEEADLIIYRDDLPLYYFLEINTLLDVIEGWQEIAKGNEATENDIVRVVIYYARHDSWPQPWQRE